LRDPARLNRPGRGGYIARVSRATSSRSSPEPASPPPCSRRAPIRPGAGSRSGRTRARRVRSPVGSPVRTSSISHRTSRTSRRCRPMRRSMVDIWPAPTTCSSPVCGRIETSRSPTPRWSCTEQRRPPAGTSGSPRTRSHAATRNESGRW